MDPFTLSLIAGGASLIPGLFGGDDGSQYLQKQLEQYEGIVPPDLAKAIVYTQFQQGGTLTPQQLQSLPIEAQEAIKLVESPEMRQKQEVQRQNLEQIARTGMGPQELLNLEKIRRTTAADEQSAFKSLLNKFSSMGQAGGGAALSAALSSGQASADRAAMQAMDVSAQAAANRRAAIKDALGAASSMRETDLRVAERNVENERRKQEFDTSNQLARQQWNARAREEANRLNLARQQEVMDRNIGQQNAELLRQRNAQNQMFANQMQLADAKARAYGGQASAARDRSASQAQNWANIFGGVSGLASSYGQYKNQQNRNKILGKKYGVDFDEDMTS